jgi:small subunit ribosomal protein S6
VFIADPRLTDEETVALADEYRAMITADGSASVTKEESWGKRKLAHPIQKFNEGRYHLYFIEADAKNTLPEVEQRLRQNDKVLRHLVVRTDLDLKRAARRAKLRPPRAEGAAPVVP